MKVLNNVIGIYLTDICNYKCIFCSVDNPSKTEESIVIEDIYEILAKNMNSEYKTIALWGGEPTLRKDFFDIVEKIKECNYENIIVETNGSKFANSSFLEKALDKGVNYYVISIHGADEKTQDETSLVKGSFDKTITAIKNLKERGVWVRTNTVVNKLNYKQIPSLVNMLIELGVDHINLSGLRVIGNAARNMEYVIPTYSEIWEYLDEGFKKAIESNVSVTFDVFPACTMKGYEDYQLEWDNFKMYYGDKKVKDFFKFTNSLKSKGFKCRTCERLDKCGGVFRGYIKMNGWNEFGYTTPE